MWEVGKFSLRVFRVQKLGLERVMHNHHWHKCLLASHSMLTWLRCLNKKILNKFSYQSKKELWYLNIKHHIKEWTKLGKNIRCKSEIKRKMLWKKKFSNHCNTRLTKHPNAPKLRLNKRDTHLLSNKFPKTLFLIQ